MSLNTPNNLNITSDNLKNPQNASLSPANLVTLASVALQNTYITHNTPNSTFGRVEHGTHSTISTHIQLAFHIHSVSNFCLVEYFTQPD